MLISKLYSFNPNIMLISKFYSFNPNVMLISNGEIRWMAKKGSKINYEIKAIWYVDEPTLDLFPWNFYLSFENFLLLL